MHADWTLLPRGHFPERAKLHLRANIELASSFLKLILDAPAPPLVLLAVAVQTILVTIPNAQAPAALLEGVASLSARRAQLLGCRGGGPIFRGGFAGTIILPFHRRSAERHGAELISSLRCTVLFG